MALLKSIARLFRSAAFAAGLACALATVPAMAASRNAATREYEVKAVFLFNFARFVEWPAAVEGDDAKPFLIGVLGEDPFGGILDEAVRGERLGSRRLVVKRIAHIDEAAGCDQLFICRSEEPRLGEILKQLGGRPILTVSDMPQFAEQGGMVGLVSAGGRTRIRINLEAAKASNLSISSKLLRPAEIVTTRKSSRFKRWQQRDRLAETDSSSVPIVPVCDDVAMARAHEQARRGERDDGAIAPEVLLYWSNRGQSRHARSLDSKFGDQ